MKSFIGTGCNAGGTVVTTIDVDGDTVLRDSSEFRILKRTIALQDLAIAAVEKENKELKKELEEIKKFIYKK